MQLCISLPCLTRKQLTKKYLVIIRDQSPNEFVKFFMNGLGIMFEIH
jgi:hypothetical protein